MTSLAQASHGSAAQKKGLTTSHQLCQVRPRALRLEALKKGLEGDQALSLRRKALERRGAAKREARAIPKELRALLRAAAVRPGAARQRSASGALPPQEPSPGRWSGRESCLAATRDSLSPGDERRASGKLRRAAPLLELRQLARASFDFKQQAGDFFKSAASRLLAMEERSASREEAPASPQGCASARGCKAVALLAEAARAPFGQRFAGAAGVKGNDGVGLGGRGGPRRGQRQGAR